MAVRISKKRPVAPPSSHPCCLNVWHQFADQGCEGLFGDNLAIDADALSDRTQVREVYRPAFSPAAWAIDAIIAAVDPLPLSPPRPRFLADDGGIKAR